VIKWKSRHISFHKKTDDGTWLDLCSLPVGDLEDVWPFFSVELERDSYYSVNTFHRCGEGKNKNIPCLPRAYRRAESLKYLNACFVDIDTKKKNLDVENVVAEVERTQAKGLIPPESILVRSGQGLWLFWLLVDPDNLAMPARANRINRELWKRIQFEICNRLEYIGADQNSKDLSRVTRIPGSIHSGANKQVSYTFREDRFYTLDQLQQFFGVVLRPRPARAVRSKPKDENRRRAWLATWEVRLADFNQLRDLRGGFRKGCRTWAVMIYDSILLRCGFKFPEMRDRVLKLARECKPGLSTIKCRELIDWAIKNQRLSDRKIAKWLKITPEESRHLEVFKPFAQYPPKAVKLRRAEMIAARRAEILRIRDENNGKLPSVRQMTEILRGRGFSVGKTQVGTDYRGLRLSGF
jgi:hypothetical protein